MAGKKKVAGLSVRVDEEIDAELTEEAKSKGVSMSDYLRDLIRRGRQNPGLTSETQPFIPHGQISITIPQEMIDQLLKKLLSPNADDA